MGIRTQEEVVDTLNGLATHKAVIITTGGGSGVFQALLNRGNGSNTLLAGYVPYSTKETSTLLGKVPEKMVSGEVARSLAMVAYQKALQLRDGDYEVIGVACTASLQRVPSEREGREHAIYVALQTKNMTHTMSFKIKGTKDQNAEVVRIWEEEIATNLILNELANGHDLELQVRLDTPVMQSIEYDWFENEKLGKILSGEIKFQGFVGTDTLDLSNYVDSRTAIFPGSFNPTHSGHREMMEIVARRGCKVIQEISIANVDKPAVDFISIRDRLVQNGMPMLITNAPTFVEKSRLFHDAKFIIGYDTYERILNPKYAGSIEYVCSMFTGNRNYFYIFPRSNGKALGLWGTGDTVLPGEWVLEPRKYEHVSSTDLRKENA
jgi:hypothetical protein